MTDRFTAADVARFCGVDPKTIHNWAARGTIAHARTEGRHLRFARADVVAFLRSYAYPIPGEIRRARPKVLVVDDDPVALSAARRALARRFDVHAYARPFEAIVMIGVHDPDVVVAPWGLRGIDVARCIADLHEGERTRHTRVVILAAEGGTDARDRPLDSGATAVAPRGNPARLRDILEELTGLRG